MSDTTNISTNPNLGNYHYIHPIMSGILLELQWPLIDQLKTVTQTHLHLLFTPAI